MRAWILFAPLVACASSAKPQPPAPAVAPTLVPFARLHHPATLVRAPDRAIVWFSVDGAWFSIDDRGFHADPDLAAEVARLSRRIGGDTIQVVAGRTVIVAGTDAAHAQLARPGDAALTTPPGVVEDVLPLGDGELWRYRTATGDQLARVDRAGAVRVLPPLARIGPDVALPSLKATCADPHVDGVAPAGADVVALISECDPATDLRAQTVRADGSAAVRRLAPITTTGLAADDFMFAAAPDGTPVLAGILDGRLAIARATPAGTWTVTPSTVALGTFAAPMAIDGGGAVWTSTLGRGADGRDEYLLERDGAVVDLRDPDGHPLSTHDFVIDAHLGVIAIGHRPGGSVDDPAWLLAEHPPAGGPLRDLP